MTAKPREKESGTNIYQRLFQRASHLILEIKDSHFLFTDDRAEVQRNKITALVSKQPNWVLKSDPYLRICSPSLDQKARTQLPREGHLGEPDKG